MSKNSLKIKNSKFFIVLFIFILGAILGGLVSKDRYKSKTDFCLKMAKIYLEDFMAKEVGSNDSLWNKAVDIETDMYNLCILGTDDKSLGNFKSVVIDKYSK